MHAYHLWASANITSKHGNVVDVLEAQLVLLHLRRLHEDANPGAFWQQIQDEPDALHCWKKATKVKEQVKLSYLS